eukprot:g3416.t1
MEEGLKLTSHYVYKYCAPTRGSLLTGRYPYKLSATRANLIPWTLPDGISLGYSMIPEKLKAANYTSVHVGKWHQGLYTPQFTPTGRGFTRSYGFLEGGEDHNTSRTFGNWCKKNEVDLQKGTPDGWLECTSWDSLQDVALHGFYDPSATDIANYNPFMAGDAFATEEGCRKICSDRVDCAGYSWRESDSSHQYYHRCFLVSKVGTKHVQDEAFRSAICNRNNSGATVPTATTIPAWGDNGTYTGDLFARHAVEAIREHDASSSPLFLYLALHNTHAPLEAPWEYVEQYAHFNDTKREIFSGMLSFVDATVKNVTDALKAKGMWENSLVVWTTDNGSPVFVGGSNHPLRGGKGSNWEGGTRVPAFVTGGYLPESQRGQTHDGLMHISDWHTTIVSLAGLDPRSGEPSANSPLDGIDAWPWISGRQPDSERDEIVYDHHMFDNASADCLNVSGRCLRGAIMRTSDGMKLIVGPEAQNDWFGWFSPNVTNPINGSSPSVKNTACAVPNPCLFNVTEDMTEHEDLAETYPEIVAELLDRFKALGDTYHPPQKNPLVDLGGYCKAVELNGGFVGPWMKEPNAATRA